MDASVLREIDALGRASVTELRDRYQELFGEASRSFHKQLLYRRVAWRLQALAEGDLSERARRRALDIADDADLRVRAPLNFVPGDATGVRKAAARSAPGHRDGRLPPPGTLLTREFRGVLIAVQVREEGFDYEGRIYRSLTAIACEVTGTRWNGYVFFGLQGPHQTHAKRK